MSGDIMRRNIYINKIITNSYKDTVEELNIRKRNNPRMIHSVKYDGENFTIESLNVKEYVSSKVLFAKRNFSRNKKVLSKI